jgi:hypothetical protein
MDGVVVTGTSTGVGRAITARTLWLPHVGRHAASLSGKASRILCAVRAHTRAWGRRGLMGIGSLSALQGPAAARVNDPNVTLRCAPTGV